MISADPGNEFDATVAEPWVKAYNKLSAAAHRNTYGHGQVMRFAPEAPGNRATPPTPSTA